MQEIKPCPFCGSKVELMNLITPRDVISVLNMDDPIRHALFYMQLREFVEWWLEQDTENTDELESWCDISIISKKWNEYAGLRNDRYRNIT